MALIRFLSLLVLALGLALGGAAAQTAGAPSFAEWERDAARAEEAVTAARASNAALETLRGTIVAWRTEFVDAQSANKDRVDTLKAQLTKLGEPPKEGDDPEPDEIANRRKQLDFQIKRLQAPALAAEEAWSRADGIVKSIDGLIRERQANALLTLAPVPLNPANWPEAVSGLWGFAQGVWAETARSLANPARQAQARAALPATLLMLAVGLALLWRGRRAVAGLTRWLETRASRRWAGVLAMAVTLGQVVLPVLGVALLAGAVVATGMAGLRLEPLLQALPGAAFAVFYAHWLGGRLFAPARGSHRFTALLSGRSEARLLVSALGLLSGLESLRQAAMSGVTGRRPQITDAVTAFPVLALVGLALVRLGLMLRRDAAARLASAEAARQPAPLRLRLLRPFGAALVVVGTLGPLLAAVGYVSAAQAMVWPMVQTLGLIGGLVFLQGLIAALHSTLTARTPPAGPANWADEGAETTDDEETAPATEGLLPVLTGLVLAVVAVPLLALIWGAREADLAETWQRILKGFTVGNITISPSNFLVFAVVLVIGYTLTRWVKAALATSILPKTRLDAGGQNAIASGVGYLGIILSALMAITTAGIDLSSLAIVAGALSVGIGFGLQNIVSNFVSGIILLIERPVSIGDMIEVDKQTGVVRAISVRSTRVETFDRTELILPNSNLISGVVTNLTRGNLTSRLIVKVGVDYGSDTEKVARVLREIAEAQPMVLISPPPNVFFMAMGADALQFEIRCIVADVNQKLTVASNINHAIVKRFREEGINIPFPQHDILIKNPEAISRVLAESTARTPRDPAPTVAAPAGVDASAEVAEVTDTSLDAGDKPA